MPSCRTLVLSCSALLLGIVALAAAQVPAAPPSQTGPGTAPERTAADTAAIAPRPASTMSELMIRVIYPTSDAVFYVGTRAPASDAEWGELQSQTLMLAESANLLMLPGRARDTGRWMADAKLMFDAGVAAFRAAKAKDMEALEAVNDQLYQSCVQCHQHYRPGYGTRRP